MKDMVPECSCVNGSMEYDVDKLQMLAFRKIYNTIIEYSATPNVAAQKFVQLELVDSLKFNLVQSIVDEWVKKPSKRPFCDKLIVELCEQYKQYTTICINVFINSFKSLDMMDLATARSLTDLFCIWVCANVLPW